MAYTTIDDPSAYFQTTIYTGTGSSQAITNTGNSNLQPDWVWIKNRDGTRDHYVYDSVRGVNKNLFPNLTNAESTDDNDLMSYNTDGFTLGGEAGVGASGETFVSWQWKAGTSFTNDASSTGIGSIDSAGSVSTTAGFSIISYTGNGTGGATIAHGLGVTPNVLIIKNRADASQAHWAVYHDKSFVNASDPNIVYLQNTAAAADDTNIRHSTATTNSTVFSVGDYNGVNGSSDNIIAYCFAQKQGYSKFGSYAGNNNANGTFVYTGFKPAFLMVKRYGGGTQNWIILDNKRNPFNLTSLNLKPNSNAATATNNGVDLLSNGFKFRSSDGDSNGYSDGYIYMAFAESPFVTSTGVPATAR